MSVDVDDLDTEAVEGEKPTEPVEAVTDEDDTDAVQEVEPEGDTEGEPEGEPEDESVVVTIGEQEPEEEVESAPEWVRELRRKNREVARENKTLKSELEALRNPVKEQKLGAKPKLADFDYDSDEYEAALADWFEQKRKADERARQAEEEQRQREESWQKVVTRYNESKESLKVQDFEDAEETVMEIYSDTQQGILLQGPDDPALMVYALGKNPERAKELASITNPVKFTFAVAQLYKEINVKPKKQPPPPEKVVTGSAPKSGAVDSTLERLRAKAEKTGDYSEVIEYRRRKAAK